MAVGDHMENMRRNTGVETDNQQGNGDLGLTAPGTEFGQQQPE